MFGYKAKHAAPDPNRLTPKEATTDELIYFLRFKRMDGDPIIHEVLENVVEALGLNGMLSDWLESVRAENLYQEAQMLGGNY